MANKCKTRLYVEEALHDGALLTFAAPQANQLRNVLRCREGDAVAVFNGRDGEWEATLTSVDKKSVQASVDMKRQALETPPDVWLYFAPVKNEKIDFLARRAVELGVAGLQPVFTEYTAVKRINTDRMRSNMIEAAEQCGRTEVPKLAEPIDFLSAMADFPAGRTLLFCDESGGGAPLKELLPNLKPGSYAVLIGPEGGFSAAERRYLQQEKAGGVIPVSLGPRILRAETAALAILANVMPWIGDWSNPASFEPPYEATATKV